MVGHLDAHGGLAGDGGFHTHIGHREVQGDMLFMPVGAPKPTRIQGTFVRDEEISRVLDFIKSLSLIHI